MHPTLHFPDAVPELLGDTVYLRELTEVDLPAWFARASDRESAAMAGDPVPESMAVGYRLLERNRERFREQTGIRWAIVPMGATDSVGSIGLSVTSKEARVAELGVVIGRAHWGRGIGTSAGRLVTRFAFDSLGLVEIRAELLQSNVASRRLLEKVGFRFQEVIPDFEKTETYSEDGFRYVLRSGS